MEVIFLNLHDWSLPIKNPVFVMCLLLLTVLTMPALVQRFRLPGIIGLILGGAILGPHGINLMEQGEGIQLLSKIGLLYIMFSAGLEIDMASFLKNRHKSGMFGALTFGLPLLGGLFTAKVFLGMNWMAAFLLAAMFSTHTLISYPIVNRLRVTRNEAVAVAVGGTIITDTLALLVLSVISGMAQGNMDIWFWVKMVLSLAIFGGLVFGLLPLVARWFFRRVESDVTYQFVFVLTMVFLAGLLAELAGIEAIIGAFLAGLVLNRLIPHESPLMERIEFIGTALFIPVFLFSVGMLINLHVFLESPRTIVTALILTAFGIASKWLAAFITQKIYGYSPDQGRLIFGLSASRAAATIAIALIGYQLKIFDETLVNATVFLIVATCLISTLVAERAALRLAANATTEKPIAGTRQCILVPISNPASVAFLLDFAFLIKTPGSSEPVYPLSIILDEKDVREKIKENQQLMEPVLRHAAERDIALSPIHRVDVSAVTGIQHAATELLATEIVIGWHPTRSATERLFGTLLDNLLDDSPEMLFVGHMLQSPFGFRRLRVILPALSQLEPSFVDLLRRLENIAHSLGMTIHLLATATTTAAATAIFTSFTKEKLSTQPLEPTDWWQMHTNLSPDELPIFVSARPESVSHEGFLERIPNYLAENFADRSFVVVYPGL